jgi:hypothetical protein
MKLTMLAVLLGGCTVGAGFATGVPVVEPAQPQAVAQGVSRCHQEFGNDSGDHPETAARIGFDRVEGCVTEDDTKDGYVIEVEPGTYDLSARLLDDYGSIELDVYDLNGKDLGNEQVKSFETGTEQFHVRKKTTVFIKVTGFNYNDDKIGRYTLNVAPQGRVARSE